MTTAEVVNLHADLKTRGLAALRAQYVGANLSGANLGGLRVVDVEPATKRDTGRYSAVLDDGRALSLHFLIVSGALPGLPL